MKELYKLAVTLRAKSAPKDIKELNKLASALVNLLRKKLTQEDLNDLLKELP
jgi:hypothetical protein